MVLRALLGFFAQPPKKVYFGNRWNIPFGGLGKKPQQGIISPKLQLLSGHTTEQSLAIYRALALSDVAEEYEKAMKTFPVR